MIFLKVTLINVELMYDWLDTFHFFILMVSKFRTDTNINTVIMITFVYAWIASLLNLKYPKNSYSTRSEFKLACISYRSHILSMSCKEWTHILYRRQWEREKNHIKFRNYTNCCNQFAIEYLDHSNVPFFLLKNNFPIWVPSSHSRLKGGILGQGRLGGEIQIC